MTDTTQSKENIQKYRSVFHHSMGYGMTWKIQRKFYEKKIDDIEPAIDFVGLFYLSANHIKFTYLIKD